MADTEQEKTEAATPKRRSDALEEGRVPRSQEVSSAALLLGAAITLQALSPGLGRALLEIFGAGIAGAGTELDTASAIRLVQATGWKVLAALAGILGVVAAIALAVGGAQSRGVIAKNALQPKWGKLNPLANGKRMIGVQPWMELLKALMKLLIVGLAVHVALRAAWPDIVALAQQSPAGLLEVSRRYGVKLLLTAGLSYLVLAGLDYAYQLWTFEKGIRMTKEEVKQEFKNTEGDQNVKARRRSIARQLARRQMMRDVPMADVVLVNPTHIAVAIRYDPMIAPAPMVVAMGKRKVAERIKKLAFESDVPVIENRPLARALIASAQVGQLIPVELYAAVAEVLAFVIRQRAARGSTWQGTVTV